MKSALMVNVMISVQRDRRDRDRKSWKFSIIIFEFETKKIFSITLDEDKLVIVYNDKSQEIVEVNNPQLQQIKAVVENQPNQTLSFSELRDNSTSSSLGNNKLYQGIVIGALSGVILVGLALVLIVRKKSSSKKN